MFKVQSNPAENINVFNLDLKVVNFGPVLYLLEVCSSFRAALLTSGNCNGLIYCKQIAKSYDAEICL